MSNDKHDIKAADLVKYVFGLKKNLVEKESQEEAFEVPMDEDGNGIPDWLEKEESKQLPVTSLSTEALVKEDYQKRIET